MQCKPLILIVDDEAERSAMFNVLFRRKGWDVHSVLTGSGDGERALAAVGRKNFRAQAFSAAY